jgi:phosphotransferase system, enzyme I, PtsP
MPHRTESESRKLLGRLREVMAGASAGQARLDRIVKLIAGSMETEVCSIYLFRDAETLELCATEGLKAEAVHVTRMRLGEGLVGRVARRGQPINTANAPQERGFRYMPETGEEIYSSFLGVPIQRLGEKLGVLVVQSKEARSFSDDEIYALEVVAMVLAEMAELGAFVGEGAALKARHTQPVMIRGDRAGRKARPRACLAARAARGHHQPHRRRSRGRDERLHRAVEKLRLTVDAMLSGNGGRGRAARGLRGLPHVRQFAQLDAADGGGHRARPVGRGGGREGAEPGAGADGAGGRRLPARPAARSRRPVEPAPADPDRAGRGDRGGAAARPDPRGAQHRAGRASGIRARLRGIVLEQGSVGSHAAIVARAWAIPLVIHAERITPRR